MDYSPQVWQRFRSPRHAGVLTGQGVHSGWARTPASKAVIRLHLQVGQGVIRQARFQAYGCPSVIATADWICEWLQGREAGQASRLDTEAINQALQLLPTRRYCAVLAEDAVMAALSNGGA